MDEATLKTSRIFLDQYMEVLIRDEFIKAMRGKETTAKPTEEEVIININKRMLKEIQESAVKTTTKILADIKKNMG